VNVVQRLSKVNQSVHSSKIKELLLWQSGGISLEIKILKSQFRTWF